MSHASSESSSFGSEYRPAEPITHNDLLARLAPAGIKEATWGQTEKTYDVILPLVYPEDYDNDPDEIEIKTLIDTSAKEFVHVYSRRATGKIFLFLPSRQDGAIITEIVKSGTDLIEI
jgi:hypothetical protein